MNGLWNTYGGRSLAGTDNARGNICNLNEDDLQHYHAASQSRVDLDLYLNGSYYYNVIYMEEQEGCMCSRHSLKMLLHPHVLRHSRIWEEIERNESLQPDVGRFWNNRTTLFLLDALGILLPRAKLELNFQDRLDEAGKRLLFELAGMSQWTSRFGTELIGFLCFTSSGVANVSGPHVQSRQFRAWTQAFQSEKKK